MNSGDPDKFLAALVDKDGLLPTRLLEGDGPEYAVRGCEGVVRIAPDALGVAQYMQSNPSLWASARLRVTTAHKVVKRAPVFGVPFSAGLRSCLNGGAAVRSVFQRPDSEAMARYGVIATLCARFTLEEHCRKFEAYQLLSVDSITHYVHAEFSKREDVATHLDGSTMEHSVEAKRQIAQGRKVKGEKYQKHWRLDGQLPLSAVTGLFDSFMPLDDLTAEFFARPASTQVRCTPRPPPTRPES